MQIVKWYNKYINEIKRCEYPFQEIVALHTKGETFKQIAQIQRMPSNRTRIERVDMWMDGKYVCFISAIQCQNFESLIIVSPFWDELDSNNQRLHA